MAVGGTRVVQITNIAPQATKDQMQALFGYLGKIDDIRLYPTIRDVSCPVQSRICYVKFMDSTTVGIAQHMTNTVFIDRALIVIPIQNGDIPDEHKALEMTNNGTIVPGLYPAEPKLPPNVVNSIGGIAPNQVVQTHDPQLEICGLPGYPPLPATYDSRKIEEIRRTILMSNYDGVTGNDEINDFFAEAGEVKYIRLCTRNLDGTTHALVEFSEQQSVLQALKLNGRELNGKMISVNHATQAIVKPQAKSNEAAQREIEEAMSRVKEAQSLISAAIDPVIGMLSKEKRSSRRSRSRSRGRRRRSRSRSRSRRRSRSRHRSRRSRSRSKRSRSRDRRRRSKSATRRRSSRSRSRSRRRSRSRKSRSKSRSKSTRKDNKDRGKSKDKDLKKKESVTDVEEKRPSKDKKKTSRSRSRSRRRSRSRDRKRSGSRSRKRSRSRGRSRRRSNSPRTSKKRSRSRESKSSRDKDRKRDRKDKKDKEEKEASDTGSSTTKVPRNYDEEEKGFDSEKDAGDKNGDSKHHESHDESSQDSSGNRPEKESSEKSDNMDISNSP